MKNKCICILFTLLSACIIYISIHDALVKYNNYFEIQKEEKYVDSEILVEEIDDVVAVIPEEEVAPVEDIKEEVQVSQDMPVVEEVVVEKEVQEVVPEVVPEPSQNEIIYGKMSGYGPDCVGCSGEDDGIGVFAMGVRYHKDKGVRQWDGTYKKGVTYEGYYIVATDRSIPFCTVLEITNHRFEGSGIENNVPFQVIVLDRGGVIQGNRLDLFIGLETNMEIGYGKWKTKAKTRATIVKQGKLTYNSLGQRGCKL